MAVQRKRNRSGSNEEGNKGPINQIKTKTFLSRCYVANYLSSGKWQKCYHHQIQLGFKKREAGSSNIDCLVERANFYIILNRFIK